MEGKPKREMTPHNQQGGTRVQVPRQTFISLDVDSIWALCKNSVPAADWQQVAQVLSSLELVYGVEYSRVGSRAQRALGEANLVVPAMVELAGDDKADTAVSTATGAAATPAARQAKPPPDAVLASQVVGLLARAGFVGLSVRDVELGRSLNDEYINQLLIKPSARDLDRGFAGLLQVDRRLPGPAASIALFVRGYGAAHENGRLLLQKLDYLQVVAVQRAFRAARRGAAAAARKARTAAGAAASWLRHMAAAQQEAEALASDQDADRGLPAGSGDGDEPEAREGQGPLPPLPAAEQQLQQLQDHLLSRLAAAEAAASSQLPLETERLAAAREAAASRVRAAGSTLLQGGAAALEDERAVAARDRVGAVWALLSAVGVDSGATPLEEFGQRWPVGGGRACALERVSIRDVMAGGGGGGVEEALDALLGEARLVEPTYMGMVLLFRKSAPRPSGWTLARQRLKATAASVSAAIKQQPPPQPALPPPPPPQQQPVAVEVYRGIPMASWKVVFPDKLLQLRPLDVLRADLITVVGLASWAANARFDSTALDIVSYVSAIALATKIAFSYRRMSERYDRAVTKLLRSSLVASQESALTYLADAAAAQQFKQVALAYCVLHGRQAAGPGLRKPRHGLSPMELQQAVEEMVAAFSSSNSSSSSAAGVDVGMGPAEGGMAQSDAGEGARAGVATSTAAADVAAGGEWGQRQAACAVVAGECLQYNCAEALGEMRRLRLGEEADREMLWVAVTPGAASQALRQRWDALLQEQGGSSREHTL